MKINGKKFVEMTIGVAGSGIVNGGVTRGLTTGYRMRFTDPPAQ
jgi:hypothetical protein